MKKLNLIVGIICILVGLVCFLVGSIAGGLILLLLGALNVFLGIRKKQPVPEAAPEIRTVQQELVDFTVAGPEYYQDVLQDFLTEENPIYAGPKSDIIDFDGRVFEFDSYIAPAQLVPEPDNEYDKNAIKVMLDGILIGYVPKHKQAAVGPYLSDDSVNIEAEVYGGRYKKAEIRDDYDGYELKDSDYEILKDEIPYKASVRIYTIEKQAI